MSTNNVMMTENDKRNVGNASLQKQIKEEKHKLDFIKDVDKLLKKYKLPKDYLYLAAKKSSLNTDRQLYMIEVETFNNGVYDGNVTLIVHGTEDEVKKQKDLFLNSFSKYFSSLDTYFILVSSFHLLSKLNKSCVFSRHWSNDKFPTFSIY